MNVLIIGGGGREHAWRGAWRDRRAWPRCLWRPAMPAPRATPTWSTCRSPPSTSSSAFARREAALTIVGPEAPLAAGVVDAFRAAGLKIFGPTQAAAQLESSKGLRQGIHGAPSHSHGGVPDLQRRCCRTRLRRRARRADRRQGRRARRRQGRGRRRSTPTKRTPPSTRCWWATRMGAAGARVVIEDFLAGEEASFIVMVDGAHVLALASSQDHKRLRDGDQGPNTGGMGAYSPAPVVTPGVHARIMREIILPTVQRHGRRRHSLHGLPVCRRDDRRRRPPACAGIQLPHGRPGDAADHGAPAHRFCRPGGARHRRHAGSHRSGMGPARGAGRGAGRRRLSRSAAAGRRDPWPRTHHRRHAPGHPGVSRRHRAGRWQRRGKRRPRAVRHRAGRLGAPGAEGCVRCDCGASRFDGMQYRTDIGYRALAPRKG